MLEFLKGNGKTLLIWEHSGLIIPEHGTDMAQKWKPPLETLARRVLLPYDTGIDAKGYDAIIGAFR